MNRNVLNDLMVLVVKEALCRTFSFDSNYESSQCSVSLRVLGLYMRALVLHGASNALRLNSRINLGDASRITNIKMHDTGCRVFESGLN